MHLFNYFGNPKLWALFAKRPISDTLIHTLKLKLRLGTLTMDPIISFSIWSSEAQSLKNKASITVQTLPARSIQLHEHSNYISAPQLISRRPSVFAYCCHTSDSDNICQKEEKTNGSFQPHWYLKEIQLLRCYGLMKVIIFTEAEAAVASTLLFL